MPKFRPVEVVTVKSGRRERSDHALTIGHGRSGAERIRFVRRFLLRVSDAGLPEQFAVGVVSVEALRTKKCHHMLTVGGRRRRGLTGFRMPLGLRNSFVRDSLPDDLAGAFVEAIDTPAMFRYIR